MYFRSISILLLLSASLSSFGQKKVKLAINTAKERKVISPLIYGTNDDYPYAAAKRLGGNRITNFNWENNASNAGRDWYHESDNYVPWEQGVPEEQYNVPGAALNSFHTRSLAQGAFSLVTLPMAKYVAKDKNGAVSEAQKAPSNRWLNVVHRKPAALLPLKLNPDQTDNYVYTQEEINFLLNKFGKSNTANGVKAYALDNEPGLWFDSHSRMWGTNNVSVKYLLDQSFELAELIKEMDPTAQVFGPASWGVSEFENLQGAPDWDAVKGDYTSFIDLYLAKMKERGATAKKRLLDVLDLHWYPQGNSDGVSPFDNGTDYATNARRMAMTRSLWDSTYVENTWIGNDPYKVQQFLPFIPKMNKHIATYYPGTKFAITEYSYMGVGHASGGIAQADALGIFGEQGLYLATYWGGVTGYIKSGFDLYRNYDGKGGKFGDMSVKSTTTDIVNSSVHASIEGSTDDKLHIIAMNKNQDEELIATIVVAGTRLFNSARVWAFDNTNATVRQLKNVKVINNNTFVYKIPPLTACHLILTEEDLSIYPDIEEVSVKPAVGYSDGTASFDAVIKVSDGNNDITRVTADLSSFGGSVETVLTADNKSPNTYRFSQSVPAGAVTGLKSIKIKVEDATHLTAESYVNYRVIKKTPSKIIWDGDSITRGTAQAYYDANDSKRNLIKIERATTGGNTGPGCLTMNFIHDPNKYNVMTWRLSNTDNPADAVDISDFGALEFYIRSDAPPGADIEISLRDASAQLESSNSVALKAGGYITNFVRTGYSKVRIPMSAFTNGSKIHLDQVWQFSFLSNTASKGFRVWVDDFKVVPYSHPVYQPKLSAVTITPLQGYADNKTSITVAASVTDPDNNLAAVTIDMSPVSGSNQKVLKLLNGKYTGTFTVKPQIISGLKALRITATDRDENNADTVLFYKVLEKASKTVLWDGDNVNTGGQISVNPQSKITVATTGGNIQPVSMRMHLGPAAGESFGSAHWDWNEGTGDTQQKDLSSKGYLSFYIKVPNAPANLELEVFLKDTYGGSTDPVRLKADGFLTSFTGQYQLVTIPMQKLFAKGDLNKERVTRFGILSSVLPAAGVDIVLDDIVAGGSNVADVKLSVTDATCGNANGKIVINSINGGTTGFKYFVNGLPNPAGAGNSSFNGLAQGVYELRIEGADGFVYMEDVIVANVGAGIITNGSVSGQNITINVSGGTGNYTYLWSDGATTKNRTGLANGSYTVTVKDSGTNCIAISTFNVQSLRSLSAAAENEVVVHNAVSPNGDGNNDHLIIEGLSAYPENSLCVMNAGGTLVFETTRYGAGGRVFDGRDNRGARLKSGTYYYQLKYKVEGDVKVKSGYLIVKY